jgi:Zn-finger nucleic acid-binding protein
MRCPVCKNQLLGPITLLEGLPARQCSNCKGVSISSNVYLTWRRTLGREFPPKEGAIEIDPSWEVKELKLCPDCGHIMARYKVFPDTAFYIDRCRNCNGIWLDHHEWDVLIDRNLHDNVNEFFTRPWQDNLRAVETRNHLERIYLEKLGEDDYENVKQVREWLKDHPLRGMLLAFLQAEDPRRSKSFGGQLPTHPFLISRSGGLRHALRARNSRLPKRIYLEERILSRRQMLSSWSDFTRRGKMARNMRPAHAAVASSRGSLNVGRFYFRVRVVLSSSSIASPLGTAGHPESQVFDIYYDRAMKNIDDRKGQWFIYREMREE